MVMPARFSAQKRMPFPWSLGIDWLILLLWGLMLTRFWVTGKMALLLHPDYMWLANSAAVLLLGLAGVRGWQLWQWAFPRANRSPDLLATAHINLLPRWLSSSLLIAVAVFGLIYVPRPFSSEIALQRGITDTLTLTRSQPQRFTLNTAPEERTIIDWVRTLNVYPEPDAYTGQKVDVTGFVIHPPNWPADYFMISRFVLTCCAADAYPVGLPVHWTSGPRPEPDSWFQVVGQMGTDTLEGKRQLVIAASTLTAVPVPRNPYEY